MGRVRAERIDLMAHKTGDGTLRDPYLDGICDARGAAVSGTGDDNGSTGRNSRATVTPEEAAA